MSPSDPGAFSGRPTRDLEQLLRDPGTPADQRPLISEELGRRFEAELTAETGWAPPQAPPQPPPAEEPPGRGPPPVAPPPAPRRSRHTGLKIVLAVLAVLVIGVGYVAWQGSRPEPDPEPYTSSVCVTDVIDCVLEVSVPVGTSCTCTDELGNVYPGFVG
jgi:hypothetical protein